MGKFYLSFDVHAHKDKILSENGLESYGSILDSQNERRNKTVYSYTYKYESDIYVPNQSGRYIPYAQIKGR